MEDAIFDLNTSQGRVQAFFGTNYKGLKYAMQGYTQYKYSFRDIKQAKNKWDWIEEQLINQSNNNTQIPTNMQTQPVEMKPVEQAGAILGGLAAGAVLGGLTGYAIGGASREPQVVVVQQPTSSNKKRTTDAFGGTHHGNATIVKQLNSTPILPPQNKVVNDGDGDEESQLTDTDMQQISKHGHGHSGHGAHRRHYGHGYYPYRGGGGGWAVPLATTFALGSLATLAASQRPQVIVVDNQSRYRGGDGNYYNADGSLFYPVGSKSDLSSSQAQVEVHLQNVEGLKDYWEKLKSKFTGKKPPPKKEKNKKEKSEDEVKEKTKYKEEKKVRKEKNGGKPDEDLEEARYIQKKLKKFRGASGHSQRSQDEYLKTKMENRRARRFFKLQEAKSHVDPIAGNATKRDIKYMNTPGIANKLHIRQLNASPNASSSSSSMMVEDDDGIDMSDGAVLSGNSFSAVRSLPALNMLEYDTKVILAKIRSTPNLYTDTVIVDRVKSGFSELQNQLLESHLGYDTDLSMYERRMAEQNMLPSMARAINTGDMNTASLLASKYDKFSAGGHSIMNDTHKFLSVATLDLSKSGRFWTDGNYQKLLKLIHSVDFISLARLHDLPELRGTLAVITPTKVKTANLVANQPVGTEIGVGRDGKLTIYPTGYTVVTEPNNQLLHQNFFMEETVSIPVPFQILIPVVMRDINKKFIIKPSFESAVDILQITCTCALIKSKNVKLDENRTLYSIKVSNKKIVEQNPGMSPQEPGTKLALYILFEFNRGVLVRIYTVLVKYVWNKNMKIASANSSLEMIDINEPMIVDFTNVESKPGTSIIQLTPHTSYGGIRHSKNLNMLKASKGDGIPKGFPRIGTSKFAFDNNNNLIIGDGVDDLLSSTPEFLTIEESINRMNEIFTDPVKFNEINGLAKDIKNRFTNYFALGLLRDLIKTNKPLLLRLWDKFKLPLEQDRVALVYGDMVAVHAQEILELGNLSANEIDFDVNKFDQINGVVQKVMTTPLNGLLSSVAKIKTSRDVPINIYVQKSQGKKYRILEVPPESHPSMIITDFFESYNKKRQISQKYKKSMMFSIQIGKDASNQLKSALQGCPRTFSFSFDLSSDGVVDSLTSSTQRIYYSQFIYPDTNANFKSNKTQKQPALLIVERIHDRSKTELGYIGSIYIIYEYESAAKVQDDQ